MSFTVGRSEGRILGDDTFSDEILVREQLKSVREYSPPLESLALYRKGLNVGTSLGRRFDGVAARSTEITKWIEQNMALHNFMRIENIYSMAY